MRNNMAEMVLADRGRIIRDTIANRQVIFTFLLAIAGFSAASAIIYAYAERITYLNALYFTVINMTTVGFGDIRPFTPLGKFMAMFNSVLGVVLFGYLVSALNASLQPEPTRNGTGSRSPDEARIRAKAEILQAIADAIELDPDHAHVDGPNALEDGSHEAFVGVHVVIRREKPVAD